MDFHRGTHPTRRETAAGAPAGPGRALSAGGAQGELETTLLPDPAAGPVAFPQSMLAPELAQIPQYEVVKELGRGAMGVVYLARHTLMDRLQVLKVLKGELLERPRSVERFLREVRLAAQLNHPNVVRALDALPLGSVVVLVMEYVEGDDLGKLLLEQGPRPVPYACACAAQAALGLQHAHEQGLVHRDIKPSNLILTRQGKKKVVKVLDFGLAKVVREDAIDGSNTLTALNQTLGTPHYLAPEQINDPRQVDIRADIYSLGCTLYHLLAGTTPFSEAGGLLGVLSAHQSADPPPLRRARPDVSPALELVVKRMMAKDPAQRFATPIEAARALTPFLQTARTAATESQSVDLAVGRERDEPIPARTSTSVHVLRELLEADEKEAERTGPHSEAGKTTAARIERLSQGPVRPDGATLEELLVTSGTDRPEWLSYWREGDRLAEALDALLPRHDRFAQRFWASYESKLGWRILSGARDQVALWGLLDRVHDRLGPRMPAAWRTKRDACKLLQAHLADPRIGNAAALRGAWRAVGGTQTWLTLFKETLGAERTTPDDALFDRLKRHALTARAFYDDDAPALADWLTAVTEALLGPRGVPAQIAFFEVAIPRARWRALADRFSARLNPRVRALAETASDPALPRIDP
ncbi:MAG: serine/threonine-protein kinase [Isosphaeraceae bacterium]|nr:serine/threonine-protein kinase [Isosphaeraceae bacterium]